MLKELTEERLGNTGVTSTRVPFILAPMCCVSHDMVVLSVSREPLWRQAEAHMWYSPAPNHKWHFLSCHRRNTEAFHSIATRRQRGIESQGRHHRDRNGDTQLALFLTNGTTYEHDVTSFLKANHLNPFTLPYCRKASIYASKRIYP